MPDPAEALPVVPKSSSQPGMQPTPQELAAAELALNAGDGILYARMADGTVLPVRARPLGGYGGGAPGTFDGGCCPPVVTESGDVIPGVVSQTDGDVFRIDSIACNPSGATCKWGVTFFHPSRMSGAFHLRGEVRDPVTGATKWTFIAVGLWLERDSGQLHTLEVGTADNWLETGPGSGVVWSPRSPSVGWQPTGRYVMAVGNFVNEDTGPRTVTPVYVFGGPGAVPSCACDPPFPPDYGSWAVVDDGDATRYDCVGGACVARQARQYAVRFRLYPADGVTSFATEAEAITKRDQLTTQGGQYATQAACESACVAGAWVVTATGSVTRWQCPPSGSCASQAYETYTVAFVPGATVGVLPSGIARASVATQQEANAWVASRGVEMMTAHPYATQQNCQAVCVPGTYKCLSGDCSPVADADIPAALAAGAQLFSTQAQCAVGCVTPTGQLYNVQKCSTYDWFDDPPTNATQLSQAYICAADLAQRGWEAVAVTRAVAVNACGGATSNVVTISGRCPGTPDYDDLGPARTLLRYNVTGVGGWYEDQFRAPRCVPNPAP